MKETKSILSVFKVGSRRVMQVCAIIMISLSVLGKFCAVFVTIPDPILGGIYIVMFGMLNCLHCFINYKRVTQLL